MIEKILIAIYMIFLLLIPDTLSFGFFTYAKLLFILTFIILIYQYYKNKKIFFKLDSRTIFIIGLFIFSLWVFGSNILDSLLKREFYLSNYYEVLRGFTYIGIFINFIYFFKNQKQYLVKLMLICTTINCLFAISQHYNFLGTNELYIKCIAPTQYTTLVNDYPFPRALGLTSNPNVFGFLIALTSIFTLNFIIKERKKLLVFLYFLQKFALYTTLSRSSFICYLIGEAVFIFAYYLIKKRFIKSFVYSMAIISFEIVLLLVLPDSLVWRFKQLKQIDQVNSWESRQEKNQFTIDEITFDGEDGNYYSMVVGVGSNKVQNKISVYDNEFLVLLYRYGFGGLLILLATLISPLFLIKNDNKNSLSLYISTTIAGLFYMYPAALYHSYKLFPIFLSILAYSLSLPKEELTVNKKKILVVATYFPPAGGVGVFRVTKYVKYLKKNGYIPVVLTVNDKFYTNLDENLCKDIEDVKVYRLDFKIGKFCNLDKSFLKAAKKKIKNIILKEKPANIFLTGGPFNILLLGRYIYDCFQIPYIIDLRDIWSLQVNTELKGYKKLRYELGRIKAKIKENYIFEEAKYICTVNSIMQDTYAKVYKEYKDKIVVISNGYDIDDYKVIPKKLKGFNIVYAGKYIPSLGCRNPRIMFKVIKQLRDNNIPINYISIGPIEKKIIKICEEEKCTEYCGFLGFLSHDEVISYYLASNLNLVLTTNESVEQSGKIFDCINCENPILIISDVKSNLTDMCENIDGIKILKYNDEKRIYNYIKDLYKKPPKKYRIDQKFNKYDRNKLTEELIKLIEK